MKSTATSRATGAEFDRPHDGGQFGTGERPTAFIGLENAPEDKAFKDDVQSFARGRSYGLVSFVDFDREAIRRCGFCHSNQRYLLR